MQAVITWCLASADSVSEEGAEAEAAKATPATKALAPAGRGVLMKDLVSVTRLPTNSWERGVVASCAGSTCACMCKDSSSAVLGKGA